MRHVDPALAAADATPTAPPTGGGPAAAGGMAERRLELLGRLAEIGLEVAEAVGRSAAAAEPATPGGASAEAALAFARVSRAVRLTLVLQARLEGEHAGAVRAAASAQRGRIHRAVERAIEAEHHDDAEAAEALSDAAWERLRDDEDFEGLMHRPLDEAVARICADLGLASASLDLPPLGEVSAQQTKGALGRDVGGGARQPPSRPSAVLPPEGEDRRRAGRLGRWPAG